MEKEEKFRKIFDYSNDAIFIINPAQDKIVDANPSACKMLGYSYKELLEMPMTAIHPHEIERFMNFAKTVTQNRSGWTNELSCMTKTGACVPSEISASILEIDKTNYIIAMIRDVSERQMAKKKLQEAHDLLEQKIIQRTAELSNANVSLKQALSEVEKLKNRFHAEKTYLQQEIKRDHNFEEIIGSSEIVKNVLRKVEQVAATNATVLILGETGTGKELFARAVHNISKRHKRSLVKVNCAALPVNLIESELFGHEKGAFTGALSQKIGRFELADKGTIFLDEIGDLPLELQAKLLRVLQEGEFERLGNSKTIKVDVRVIAATNRDLEKEVLSGIFRKDLFYRLNVFPIVVPPLRERKEDIEVLLKFFIKKYSAKIGKKIDKISTKVIDILKNYYWPGNVRELENIIERSLIISHESEFNLGDWNIQQSSQVEFEEEISGNSLLSLEELEKKHIIKVLEITKWKVSGENGAAKFLNLKPTTLDSKMKKLGIKRIK